MRINAQKVSDENQECHISFCVVGLVKGTQSFYPLANPATSLKCLFLTLLCRYDLTDTSVLPYRQRATL